MIQLVQPDLSVVGTIEECLDYARRVFHVRNLYPNAWTAWENTQFKHTDRNLPTDVAVLMWYSYTATLNGVKANYGHGTVNVPGIGIFSSPYLANSGHARLSSITEVEQKYTTHLDGGTQPVTYVGWSEDINGVRIAEGNNMTKEQAQELSLYLRLLDFESVDEANTHSEDDVNHILADPGYAGALAKAIYSGGNWQQANEDLVAYRKGGSKQPTVVVNGTTYVPSK